MKKVKKTNEQLLEEERKRVQKELQKMLRNGEI